MNKKSVKVEISAKTILFFFLFLAGILLMWNLRSILFLFFICTILMEALNPVVNKIEKQKISRPIAILLIYLGILVFVSITVASIIPALVTQVNGLVNFLPDALENLNVLGFNASELSLQLKLLDGLPASIAKTTISIFSNLLGGIIILMITFYMLMERKEIDGKVRKLFGDKIGGLIVKVIGQVEYRLANWGRAELSLMLIIGTMSYLGYLVLGIDFALALAIIAGILEVIPNIGPTVATILAAIVALNSSPVIVVLTIIWGILIQQAENGFIVPKIMKQQVGLNPVVTLFVLAVGSKLAGAIGALLAIPSYLAIETAIRVIIENKKDK